MDFITLADSALQLHRKLSGGEDDDFTRLESPSSTSQSNAIYESSQTAMPYDTTTLSEEAQTRPLLSPSAEAELFLLATNFLLCT